MLERQSSRRRKFCFGLVLAVLVTELIMMVEFLRRFNQHSAFMVPLIANATSTTPLFYRQDFVQWFLLVVNSAFIIHILALTAAVHFAFPGFALQTHNSAWFVGFLLYFPCMLCWGITVTYIVGHIGAVYMSLYYIFNFLLQIQFTYSTGQFHT